MADKLIGELHAAEPAITERMRLVERINKFGGRLVGLDFRLKGEQRLKEKIVDAIKIEADLSVAEALAGISDAIRYTFCLVGSNYAPGYREMRQSFELAGYQMLYCKNHWLNDPRYKGVNTRWETIKGAQFELQLHTPESLHAKEHLTHPAYERLRSRDANRAERRALDAYQRAVSGSVPRPAGIGDIPNHQNRSQ